MPILRLHLAAVAAALFGVTAAPAQDAVPTTFPEDAAPITPELFKEKVVGHVYKGTTVGRQHWRMEFKDEVTFFWGNGTGPDDSGKVRIEGNKFCAVMKRGNNDTCNDFRVKDNAIYYKRVSNGEVVMLQMQ